MKSWNRRPLIGRLSIASCGTVDVRTVAVVSTRGVAAVTVTFSAMADNWRVWSYVTLAPTVSATRRVVEPKPASSMPTS